MTTIAIQCANCGAKYKLPETFTGEKAKCKACGSTIDVKAARNATASAPAAPAAPAPRPAARAEARPEPEAKPLARPVASRAERKAEAEAPAERPRRAGREGREEGSSARGSRGSSRGGSGRGSRGGSDGGGAKKSNTGLVVGVIGGGVVIIGLVLWLVLGGKGNEPAKVDNASNTPSPNEAAKPSDAASTPKEAPKKEEPKKEEPKKPDAAKQDPAKGEPAKADPAKQDKSAPTADKPKTEPEPKDAAAKAPDKATYGNKNIKTKEDAFVPSKSLKPLEHEEGTSDDRKKELEEMVETVVSGGGPAANKAKIKLKEIGRPAMVVIINRLREIDYFDKDQTVTAFHLNKVLEEFTGGMNALFKLPEGDIDPQRADYNGHTVEVWQKLMEKYPTSETFAKWANDNKAKKAGRDEGDK